MLLRTLTRYLSLCGADPRRSSSRIESRSSRQPTASSNSNMAAATAATAAATVEGKTPGQPTPVSQQSWEQQWPGVPYLGYANQLSSQPSGMSPICRFFAGSKVLVTGATGFMGKVLLQKLLRSAPDVGTVYLLIRSKKGKEPSARLDELFEDKLFECMKVTVPEWRSKLQLVAGDCSQPGLGLNEADRDTLRRNVNVIFHGAATVRFDEALGKAIGINVRGTKQMFDLAREMPHLKAFAHISTAYSHCTRSSVNETFYEASISYDKAIELAETLDEATLELLTPKILGNFPNSYVFTKMLAEDVAKKEGHGLPLVVFRPAIVVSTWKDPVPGWIDNVYGPTGVAVGAGVGLLRVLNCDADAVANIVPVDMAVNALIAATWDVACNPARNNNNNNDDNGDDEIVSNGVSNGGINGLTKGLSNGVSNGYHKPKGLYTKTGNNKNTDTSSTVPIYNYVSSCEAPIKWRDFKHLMEKQTLMYPTVSCVWYYCFRLTNIRLLYLLHLFLLHWIPAVIMDSALMLARGKPQMIKAYKKIHRFSEVIAYFSTRHWEFNNQNVVDLWSSLDKEDKEIFLFDMKQLDWEDFFKTYGIGARFFFLKDDLSTLPESRRRWNRFFWIHQCLKLALVLLLVWFLWPVITYWASLFTT